TATRSAPVAAHLLFLFRFGCGESGVLKARCAVARCAGVVRRPVVLEARYPRVVRRPVVRMARYAGVVRTPVVRMAGGAQPDRVLGVVPCTARCAGGDSRCAWFRARRGGAG